MLAIDSSGTDQPITGLPESRRQNAHPPRTEQSNNGHGGRWLSINAACEILGVDKSTLRRWSDNGRVPVFRTPGGHRRYSEDDLHAFLSGKLVEQHQVSRRELAAMTRDEFARRQFLPEIDRHMGESLSDDCAADLSATRDRMIDMSIRYASGRGDPDVLLATAHDLARDYGRCTAKAQLETSEAVASFLRFRRPMLDALGRYVEKQNLPVRRSCRMIGKLNGYLDVMLTTLVEAHEAYPEG